MANKNAPFGARVIDTFVAADYSGKVHKYKVPSTDGTALFLNDFVSIVQNSDDNGIPYVTKTSPGQTIRGIVQSFSPLDDNPTNRNYRLANEERIVYVIDDPEAEFEIQVNGTLLTTYINQIADIAIAGGNTDTGISTDTIDLSTIAVDGSQLLILGISEKETNEFGDYSVVRAKINLHDSNISSSIWERIGTTILPVSSGDDLNMYGGDIYGDNIRMSSALYNETATMYGTNTATHVALGTSTVTGLSGQNYSGCLVLGGDQNEAKHNYAIVVGGSNNETVADYTLIGGGIDNTISNVNGQVSCILHGYNNTISASNGANNILCGESNTISGTVTAGIISGFACTISGDSEASIISSLAGTIENSDFSAVVGGNQGEISGTGDNNLILGGSVAIISSTGDHNTIINGHGCQIGNTGTPSATEYSLVGGRGCYADAASYSFVYGRKMILTTGANGCFAFGYDDAGTVPALSDSYTAYFYPHGEAGKVAINGITSAEQALHVGGEIISQKAEDTDFDNDEVLSTGITDGYGMIVVAETTGQITGIFRLDYHTISAVAASATFSMVKDTGAHYNVYWETDQVKVQNKVGNDKNVRVGFFGTK